MSSTSSQLYQSGEPMFQHEGGILETFEIKNVATSSKDRVFNLQMLIDPREEGETWGLFCGGFDENVFMLSCFQQWQQWTKSMSCKPAPIKSFPL